MPPRLSCSLQTYATLNQEKTEELLLWKCRLIVRHRLMPAMNNAEQIENLTALTEVAKQRERPERCAPRQRACFSRSLSGRGQRTHFRFGADARRRDCRGRPQGPGRAAGQRHPARSRARPVASARPAQAGVPTRRRATTARATGPAGARPFRPPATSDDPTGAPDPKHARPGDRAGGRSSVRSPPATRRPRRGPPRGGEDGPRARTAARRRRKRRPAAGRRQGWPQGRPRGRPRGGAKGPPRGGR